MLSVHFKYTSTVLKKYTLSILYKNIMDPFKGSFVSVGNFKDGVQLTGCRVTARTYF